MTEEPSTVAMLRMLFDEASDYARNLARLFATELSENSRSLRYLAAMAGAAALLLLTSFLFVSGALVGAVAWGLASWPWALLVVGVGYGFIGLFMMLPLAHAVRKGLLKFEHTRQRVKADAEWVKQKLAA